MEVGRSQDCGRVRAERRDLLVVALRAREADGFDLCTARLASLTNERGLAVGLPLPCLGVVPLPDFCQLV